MAISVTCTSCDKLLKAPGGSAGKKIKCPDCGAALRVPDADDADLAPRRRKKKRKSPAVSPLLWVGVGAGVLAVVIAVVVLVLLNVNRPGGSAGGGRDAANQDGKQDRGKPNGQDVAKHLAAAVDGDQGALTNGSNTDFLQSQKKLRQLGLAMSNYHSARNKFPGAAILSRDGKKTPLLSWRVAILPEIEQDNLYRQFKLDEPWDSDHNKKLIPLMPGVYQPVRREHPDGGRTYYQVFTGKLGPFGEGREPRLQHFTDGTSNTFLIAEGERAVVWTKPEDMEYDGPGKDEGKDKTKLDYKLKNGRPLDKMGGMFANGFVAVMADGQPIQFSRNIAAWKIHAMITHNGGEVFSLQDEK
jgi:hypothetical protein